MIFRFVTLSIVFGASAFSQATDITGWSDLRWGTAKAVALKAVQSLGAHEAADADVLVIEKYSFTKVPFTVHLLFTSKNGLSKAVMTAEDRRDAFEKVLSELTLRYGRPGLQSEYDGDDEQTRTIWTWSKAHGKLSLDSDETTGIFTLTYEPRR
jgi:hypothetical protein